MPSTGVRQRRNVARAAALGDDQIALVRLDDLLEFELVAVPHCKPPRVRADRLVLRQRQLDDLVTSQPPALADETHETFAGLPTLLDRLVDLAERGLIAGDTLLAGAIHVRQTMPAQRAVALNARPTLHTLGRSAWSPHARVDELRSAVADVVVRARRRRCLARRRGLLLRVKSPAVRARLFTGERRGSGGTPNPSRSRCKISHLHAYPHASAQERRSRRDAFGRPIVGAREGLLPPQGADFWQRSPHATARGRCRRLVSQPSRRSRVPRSGCA